MIDIESLWVLILFLLLLLFGVPLGFSLGLSSASYIIFNDIPLAIIVLRMHNALSSPSMMSVILFIFAGNLMNDLGITKLIFDYAKLFIGRVRGGLGHVNILASLIFAGMSGAALADIGGLGVIEIKAMNEQGYKTVDSACITVASATIGPIFPPSIPLIVYAMVAEVSGIRILIAGILPGLLIAALLMILVAYLAHKGEWPITKEFFSKKQKMKILLQSFPALLAPIILLGGLFSGYFSINEIASVLVLYVLFLGVIVYKTSTWHTLIKTSLDTIYLSGSMIFVIANALLFVWVLTIAHVPEILSKLFLVFPGGKVVSLLVMNVILLISGMFINPSSSILIFTPIFLPLCPILGISPIHLGIIMVGNLMIGLLTPPVGISLYVISDISKVSIDKVIKGLIPYIIVLIIWILLITFIPQLSTWLPGLI